MGDGLSAGDLDGMEGLGADEELHGGGGLGGGHTGLGTPGNGGNPKKEGEALKKKEDPQKPPETPTKRSLDPPGDP